MKTKEQMKQTYTSRIRFHKHEIKRYKELIKGIDKETKKEYNKSIRKVKGA